MLVELSIVAGAVLAGAAAIQHFYDRYARGGFYKVSRDVAVSNGKAIREAVEGLRTDFAASDTLPDLSELQANFMDLPNKIQAAVAGGIVQASTEVMKAQAGLRGLEGEQAEPIQAMGTDAAAMAKLTRSLKSAVGSDMIGPYGAVIAEWAPNVYAWLQEHPESVQWALSQPWLQGLIKKAMSMVQRGEGGGSGSGDNPFLKGLQP